MTHGAEGKSPDRRALNEILKMPQGYYTIEQWAPPAEPNGQPTQGQETPPQWTPILHLSFGGTLTDAELALQKLCRPGFYRVVQTQRVIWAEQEGGALRLRKSHASSPESLESITQMFDRTGGQYPVEEVRETRRNAKKNRAAEG